MKIIILFITVNILSCNNSENAYKQAYNYIISDTSIEENFGVGVQNIKFNVFKETIPFNVLTLSESILSDSFIPNYTLFMELNEEQRRLEKTVTDSLRSVNSSANQNFIPTNLNMELNKDSDYTIFFSKKHNNSIYAEVVESAIGVKKYTDVQGMGVTYLFVFDDKGKVTKVYQGIIHHD